VFLRAHDAARPRLVLDAVDVEDEVERYTDDTQKRASVQRMTNGAAKAKNFSTRQSKEDFFDTPASTTPPFFDMSV